MPWKRMIPQDESDSSSSDEPHEKRLKTVWRQYLMSKRFQKSNQDGQGTSSSPQDLTLLGVYPNPSDVLMHHDYVGTNRPGPSTSNQCHSVHSSMQLNDMQSISQKWMGDYRFYRDRCLFEDNSINGIMPPLVEDSLPGTFTETPADLSFKAPQQVNGGDEDENEEGRVQRDDGERFNDEYSSLIHLPIVEKVKNENISRESVLKSPLRMDNQDPNSVQAEIPSTDINPSNQPGTSEEIKDSESANVEEDVNTESNGAVPSNCSTKTQGSKDDANNSLNEVLLGLLECPVCWEVMSPPICQCMRGHLLCKPCKKRLSTCPTCRANFNINRNLAMEKVAEKLKYPCRNSGSGCTILVLLREKREHEANCPHRLYSCLSPFCAPRWTCKLTQLPNHYESLHSQMLLRGPTHLLKITHDFYRKPASLDWIILAFEQLFRVNIHLVPPGDVYGCVQYIGPHSSSKKYIYELKTKLALDTYRCITFERTTHSDQTKIERNYVKKDSFYLPDSWTKNFKSDEFPRPISRLEISVTVRPA